MPDFSSFFKQAEEKVKQLVTDNFSDYPEQALQDGKSFLEDTKEDFKRWREQLAQGSLTAEDIRWLAKGKKNVGELLALKQVGISHIRLEAFKNDLIDAVVNTAINSIDQVTNTKKEKG